MTPSGSLERAVGAYGLEVRLSDQVTRVAGLRQQGCCRILMPRRPQGTPEAVLVNVSGGIAAGDRITGEIICRAGSHLTVTTQAAERIYKAREQDTPALIEARCRVDAGARLDWLPLETIFFDRSATSRLLEIEMAGDATFLGCETRVFGRSGSDETVEHIHLRDRLRVKRDGDVLWVESLIAEGPLASLLAKKAVAAGRTVMMTLWLVAPDAETWLAPVRAVLTERDDVEAAASAWNGMLVVRGLGASSLTMSRLTRRLLSILRNGHGDPVTWRT
ncbi:urease accessory protein UreD [Acetobacter conturbans]|uniref:Urease accessory protein UreD n=1 Tax=Acetobacter conturbans TaxID=1737472 RepID=A0ABX0K1E0_9PROT|nr:urease accessory protein UreD [Acetobacter conturbans]NHN88070.1 urease accessory protein UreD [Acetobacter conturbans]